MTTRAILQNETKMSRTEEVRERLGPIMERMKASLSKIQRLEESISRRRHSDYGDKSESTDGKSTDENSNVIELGRKRLNTPNALTIVPGSSQSRQLLKSSMSMLKKKLSTLQRMEEILNFSKDRRQNLQHYILQASLSKPLLELASVKRKNQESERQLALSREECRTLEEKNSTFEYLQQRVTTLSDAVQRESSVEDELIKAQKKNATYEEELLNRQAKISRLSIRCDELECQVDELSRLCDNLEEQLGSDSSCRLPASLGGMIASSDPVDGGSTAPTESDSDSLTNRSSLSSDSPPCSPRRSAQGCSDASLESSLEQDDLMSLWGVIDIVRLVRFEDEDTSSSLPGGLVPAVIRRLLAKLDKLEKENKALKSQNRTSEKKILDKAEVSNHQMSSLQALERGKGRKEAGSSDHDDKKVSRGHLFGFFKSNPTQAKTGSKADKARLIGEGLIGGNQ